MYALWRSFTQCTFIEPEGDVLFFKNQRGEAVRGYVADAPSDTTDAGGATAKLKEKDTEKEDLVLAGIRND